MMHTLSNSEITISVSTKGAELQSIKKNNVEYLWQGDAGYWPRKAPILFPIVGRVLENQYQVAGNKYTLPQHGFARDREFELVEKSSNHLSFRLCSDQESLNVYPFEFELILTYRIQGNRIAFTQAVCNKGSQTMYYGLGNHPGFNVPLNNEGLYADYFLEFEYPEELHTYKLKNGYLSDTRELLLAGTNILALSPELFKDDALIFDLKEMKSRWVAIKSKHHSKAVKADFHEFTWLGIWSKPGPFVCLEPWAGVTDKHDHNGDFTRKTAINSLKTGEEKTYRWSIELL